MGGAPVVSLLAKPSAALPRGSGSPGRDRRTAGRRNPSSPARTLPRACPRPAGRARRPPRLWPSAARRPRSRTCTPPGLEPPCPHPRREFAAVALQRLLHQQSPLGVPGAHQPVHAQCPPEPGGDLRVVPPPATTRSRPSGCRSRPPACRATRPDRGPLSAAPPPRRAPGSNGRALSTSPPRRPLSSFSRAYCLTAPASCSVPRPSPGLRQDQRLLDQVPEEQQHVLLARPLARTHRFGRLQREAAGEHREPREQLLLGPGEQLVAPVEGGRASSAGVGEGPAPRRPPAPGPAARESVRDPRNRTLAAASSSARGSPSRPPADGGHRRRVLRRQLEGRGGRPGALHEKASGRRACDLLGDGRAGGGGQRQGPTGYSCSPRTRSGARLVTSTTRFGQVSIRAATSGADLQSGARSCRARARSRFSRRYARRTSRGPARISLKPRDRQRSGARARDRPEAPGRRRPRRPGRGRPCSRAACMARRVLPTPPGPVSVSSRVPGRPRKPPYLSSSRSLPTSGVGGAGGSSGFGLPCAWRSDAALRLGTDASRDARSSSERPRASARDLTVCG